MAIYNLNPASAVVNREAIEAWFASMSPAEKSARRLEARIASHRALRVAFFGSTENSPRAGHILLHFYFPATGRRDVHIRADGSMRWREPVTFIEELFADAFTDVLPAAANDGDDYAARPAFRRRLAQFLDIKSRDHTRPGFYRNAE